MLDSQNTITDNSTLYINHLKLVMLNSACDNLRESINYLSQNLDNLLDESIQYGQKQVMLDIMKRVKDYAETIRDTNNNQCIYLITFNADLLDSYLFRSEDLLVKINSARNANSAFKKELLKIVNDSLNNLPLSHRINAEHICVLSLVTLSSLAASTMCTTPLIFPICIIMLNTMLVCGVGLQLFCDRQDIELKDINTTSIYTAVNLQVDNMLQNIDMMHQKLISSTKTSSALVNNSMYSHKLIKDQDGYHNDWDYDDHYFIAQ